MTNMSKKTLILTSFLIAFVYVVTVSHPANAESIWEKRKKAQETLQQQELQKEEPTPTVEETKPYTTTTIDPDTIYIPDQFGSIIETHEGTNGKLIVHIQDAHMNYEAQKNSANILESLIEDYDLKLVLVEGKLTNKDFKYIREWAPLEERKEKADKLLREGYLSCVNYLDIASDYPMIMQGIEDKNIYDKQREMLWEIDKFKDLAGEYVNKMILAADAIKPNIYNADLQELDAKNKDYEKENIDLITYYDYLYKKAEAENLPLYTFPNFGHLVKASDLEKKIDLVKVRSGDATDEEMKLYNEYLDATASLNVNELFKEEPLLEDLLQDILATSSDQRKLLRISKALSIMKNLLRIKVVPEEYKYFQDNKKDFSPAFWTDFIKEKAQKLNVTVNTPDNFYIISDNLSKVEEFYGIAFERNKVFLQRTEAHLKNEGVDMAALVAGGFHTPTLTKLLADAGYSYVVISPKVTTDTDDGLYRSALKREWLPEIAQKVAAR